MADTFLLRIPMQSSYRVDQGFPPREFYRALNLSPTSDVRLLWEAYQKWRSSTEWENYQRFAGHLETLRQKAIADCAEIGKNLPNAKKGEKYLELITFPDSVSVLQMPDLSGHGLSVHQHPQNPRLFCIMGRPTVSGEVPVSFECIYRGHARPLPPIKIELKIIVNPDPRELWKNLPTDSSLEYFKEDHESQELWSGSTLMLAASIRGRSHAHKGAPRDDDFRLGFNHETGWHILAVADGAGSAPFSRQGSRLACEMAVETCVHGLSCATGLESLLQSLPVPELDTGRLVDAKKILYHILPQAVLEGMKAIRQEAEKKGREIKEYATTLLLAAAKKYPAGWAVLSFQIGDGCMAILSQRHGEIASELLAEPDEGEFGGQTRFITMQEMFESKNLMNRVRINIVSDLKALILMTDGVSDAKFSSIANMRSQKCWTELWKELEPVVQGPERCEKLLSWLEFWSPGNHDDRTIALLVENADQ